MNHVHIRDLNFFSEKHPERPCEWFEWVWDRNPQDNYLTVFTDRFLPEALKNGSEHKVAVLFEPVVVDPQMYQFVERNHDVFDFVCTFDERLAGTENFVYYPYGTTWIHERYRGVYTKMKNLSMVASDKRFTHGQRLRHVVADRFKDQIDGLFGRGYKPIQNKVDGLAYYRYSIAIENCAVDSYFSEKLMDCFLTGTVPIYWGFPKAAEFFDPEGMIVFKSPEDLDGVIDTIGEEDYERRLPAVKRNFERAQKYISFERHLWGNCLKRFFQDQGSENA